MIDEDERGSVFRRELALANALHSQTSMGAASKDLEIYKINEEDDEVPASAQDAVYMAPTRVGEGAYVAIAKLMSYDAGTRETNEDDDEKTPRATVFQSGVRPAVNDERAADIARVEDERSRAPTQLHVPVHAPARMPPQTLPLIAPPPVVPSLPIRSAVPAPLIIEATVAVPPVKVIAIPTETTSRKKELLVFAVSFFLSLVPAAIYFFTR
jgi:hypothetical protein